MDEQAWFHERQTAIHLLRSGLQPCEVAQQMGRSLSWVYKWKGRFEKTDRWDSLQSHSRAPIRRPQQFSEPVRQAIRQARSELEAEAALPGHLHYVGAPAVRARLREKDLSPLPSTATIERVLATAGMTRPQQPVEPKTTYPHVRPGQPHQLCQVDIVPRYLLGGQSVACFNAIDVVSRYPAGQSSSTKRSTDAVDLLLYFWATVGIAKYTQVDNEACFSGGWTHPGVLGKVLRVALFVGTELVFSPFYHPESNGTVERFHQDYVAHVWADTQLTDLDDVQQQGQDFFQLYRQSRHHSALQGYSPAEKHAAFPVRKLPANFRLPSGKLPLTVGRVHFMRKVSPARTIKVLNLDWAVPLAQPNQGVWATLEFTVHGATLRVYDTAPDAPRRTCLVSHPFPLKESVQPLRPEFQDRPVRKSFLSSVASVVRYTISNRAAAWLSTMW